MNIFSKEEINKRYQYILNGKENIRVGVAVALINEAKDILLERRKDCGWWGVTGGKLDVGETIEQCAIREIQEECNIKLVDEDLNLLGVYSNPKEGRILQYPDNRVHLVDVVFFTHPNNFTNLKISDESLEIRFFRFNNLPKLIVPPALTPLADISKLFL